MKHLSLHFGTLLACLCLSTQPLHAIEANVVKQKLFYAYNLIDNFVTKQEQLNESLDTNAPDYARLHHKVVRKILHWIMGGKQYASSSRLWSLFSEPFWS